MRRVALALMLLAASAAATAAKAKRVAPRPAPAPPDSPAAVLAELPALPKAAKADLPCPARDAFDRRLAKIQDAQDAARGDDRASGEWREPTDAQQQALLALNDLDFSACVTDLRQRPPDLWIGALQEKLDDALAKARTSAQALAAAAQYLRNAQPAYAAYLKDIGDCIGKRERIVATARAAHGGASADRRIDEATQDDWSLVAAAADANVAVCSAARAAAERFSGQR